MESTIAILKEAFEAASSAAKQKYDELVNRGPAYSIHEGNLLSNTVGPIIGTMLDDCGGAWIVLSGKSQFVKDLKKMGIKKNDAYARDFWWMSKGIYKGYTLHFRYALSSRQEMSVHEEAMDAAVKILQKYHIKCFMHTYID